MNASAPLTSDELRAAVDALRAPGVFFSEVCLDEDKHAPQDRRFARAVLYNRAVNGVEVAVVDVGAGRAPRVVSRESVPGVQPAMDAYEYELVERLVHAYPPMVAAAARRGISDVRDIKADPWCVGHFSPKEDPTRRLAFPIMYVSRSEGDNFYMCPLEGIKILVDLQREEVIEFADEEVVPLPPVDPLGDYVDPSSWRTDVKPLHVLQPEGPSFEVAGNQVSWQKFTFNVGFTPREGATLHNVCYEGRSIADRLSFAEMVVPYGDPAFPHYKKAAFDAGEDGLGKNAHSLKLGCDCLGVIHYTDVARVDFFGNVDVLESCVCLHEEDAGTLWKHMDWRTGRTELRRSRRLVLSFVCTVANYEYRFAFHLYQDASIEFDVRLTGILSTGALRPGVEGRKWGVTLSEGLYAPVHQHFFVARLDMAVDGRSNSLHEINTYTEPPGPDNPQRNGFYAETTQLRTEREAERQCCFETSRSWKVTSQSRRNRTGGLTAWKLLPGANCNPYLLPDAPLFRRAGFIRSHLWATPYDRRERFPGGDWPNQLDHVDGLVKWTAADRSVADEDIVLWYVFGVHHVPRVEDWPIMPAEGVQFMLRPTGFFDVSPAMDVPPACASGGRSERVRSRL